MGSPFTAQWIYLHNQLEAEKRSVLFRHRFMVDQLAQDARGKEKGAYQVRISADSRYRLYINDQYVGTGPLRGDNFRTYYDTLDIGSYLREGENVVAVHVLKFPKDPQGAHHFLTGPVWLCGSTRGGLLLDGGESLPQINTGKNWRVIENPAYTFVHSVASRYAGDQECVQGDKVLRGWTSLGFDDGSWIHAYEICSANGDTQYSMLHNWPLRPRDIPLMMEEPIKPAAISRTEGGVDFSPLLKGEACTLPANTQAVVDIDMGELVTAYVGMQMAAAGGESIELMYAESYYQVREDGSLYKGRRDDSNGVFMGETDRYLPHEGSQYYEPYFYRTFRFLRIKVVTGSQPLRLEGMNFRLTGYPLEIGTRFTAEDKKLERMWEVSVRTLLRCMHETYMDCPYYEQMQYVMDTVLEAVFTYQLSRDGRLARKAILDYISAQRLDGQIPCNAPSGISQMIAGFNFYLVDLVMSYHTYHRDDEFITFCLPALSRIMDFFQRHVDVETGLLADCPGWQFVDWVDAWRVDYGSPMAPGDRYNFIYSQMYAHELEQVARLYESMGLLDMAAMYRSRREKMVAAVNAHAWDAQKGYYRSKPGDDRFAWHAQIWAVLSGCIQGDAAKDLIERCLKDESLLSCSMAMAFFQFRAIEKAGCYEHTPALWKTWTDMFANNITTWPEDTLDQRSDCHGWSSLPLWEFIAGALGVRPLNPGWEGVIVKPGALALGHMQADVDTCKGIIKVSRRHLGAGKWQWNLTLPCEMDVVWMGGGEPQKQRGTTFAFTYLP